MTGQPLPVRMSSPLDQALEALVKAWPAALLAALGAAWAWLGRMRKRSAKERELHELEARTLRRVVDALDKLLRAQAPVDEWRPDQTEIARHAVLVYTIREELWKADGHESDVSDEKLENIARRVHTRTQRIRAKTARLHPSEPETFIDGWRGGR